MNQLADYYKILQVDPQADADVITAAYRALARRLHPDRDYTGIDEYRMSELNRAYAVLRDPVRRGQYDAERTLLQPMGPGDDGRADSPVGVRRGGLAARWDAHEARQAAGPAVQPSAPAPSHGSTSTQTADESRLTFGRYAGMTVREIAAVDGDYLRWLARHSSGLRYRREIERILKGTL